LAPFGILAGLLFAGASGAGAAGSAGSSFEISGIDESPLPFVVATPSGHLHELGAMVAAAVASAAGWRVSYLGCNLPAGEIAACALRAGARAVALGISYPSGDAAVAAELRSLRDLLPRETELMVGGRAAASYRGAVDQAGVCWITDIRSLREELGRLARNS
jgi:methylmalonyl-CoA mutase cobalamin-binding subunit